MEIYKNVNIKDINTISGSPWVYLFLFYFIFITFISFLFECVDHIGSAVR